LNRKRYWHLPAEYVLTYEQREVCGSCKDKFGLSRQIVPRALDEPISDPDNAAGKRAMDEMMTIEKIDIARIEAARRG
jgi:predicted 3-demethylubiquinone-9 3-methyltransferase (glyoxalase superfamily)